jgi:hypothetical protein
MDLTIFLDERRPREILTKIFWKKISTFQYCSYKSFHRQQSKRAWIKAELQGFRTKTSLWEDFLFTRDFFFDRLRARGYPRKFLEPIFKLVPFKTANSDPVTGKQPDADQDSFSLFIAKWTPLQFQLDLNAILNQYRDMLPATVANNRIIVAYTRTKNIAESLTRAKAWT